MTVYIDWHPKYTSYEITRQDELGVITTRDTRSQAVEVADAVADPDEELKIRETGDSDFALIENRLNRI